MRTERKGVVENGREVNVIGSEKTENEIRTQNKRGLRKRRELEREEDGKSESVTSGKEIEERRGGNERQE